MQEQIQSVNDEIQGLKGKQSKENSKLDQHFGQMCLLNNKNILEFSQMSNQLQKMQKIQDQTQRPHIQNNQWNQPHTQINLDNGQNPQKQQLQNHCSDSDQGFIREPPNKTQKNNQHHNHHYGKHHRDYNNKKQHQIHSQTGLSDQYWHQIQDRKQQFLPSSPPYLNFDSCISTQRSNQIHPYPPLQSPENTHGYSYQQQYYPYYSPHPHYYQPPYPFHQRNYAGYSQGYPPSQYPIREDQRNITVGQKNAQILNNNQKSSRCQHKKRWKQKTSGCQGYQRKRKDRKHQKSHSRSRSSSSSSEEGRGQYVNEKTKLHIQQITNYYASQLHNIFQSKSINSMQRQKVLKLLIDKYPKYEAPFQKIFEHIAYLQTVNLLHHMPYIKVIKVLIKFKFNMEYVVPKLRSIQTKKIKRYQSDLRYRELYGNQQVQPPLQHGQLIDMNQQNIIYLIDGNNVLPTQKHFRNSFQSNQKYKKLEAQIRFQWLVSFALEPQNTCLFFDEKFPEDDINIVSSILFPNNNQRERVNKLKVIYGDDTIADDKIVQKLAQIKDSQKEIILVSADRELFMRCMKITKINHTGGRFFFKFLKYMGVHRNENERYIKKLIKSVIRYN